MIEYLKEESNDMQNVAGIVAAMTPCFRLYAYIGCQLAAENTSHNHDFSNWISTYSGRDFMAQAEKIESLLSILTPGQDRGSSCFKGIKFFMCLSIVKSGVWIASFCIMTQATELY